MKRKDLKSKKKHQRVDKNRHNLASSKQQRAISQIELKEYYSGTLQQGKGSNYVISNDRTLPRDIVVADKHLNGALHGDKVVVHIIGWPVSSRNPIGEVIDILGREGDNTAEMHAILAEFGLPYKYPEAVEQYANKIPDNITEAEISIREDFRDVTTFTIDPQDAKDFDDALSIRSLGDDLWEIGVHIADCTYYIQEGTILDKEAQHRATSVYLVDRTIPMLPERLCNYLCSLRPDEEKLTYSTIFKMNSKAEILNWHIARTIIKSNRRFAYEEVQYILEQNGEASPEDLLEPGEHPTVQHSADGKPVGEYAQELITLNRLAKILRKQRFSYGGILFNRPEIRFEIDQDGKPLRTYAKIAKDANKLIEEFMLLANRHVAEFIGKVQKGEKAKTFPYRIHDIPDMEKLERLSKFVNKFGYRLKIDGSKDDINHNINQLILDFKGRKEQQVVEDVTLRSMTKARYSTHNIGHYGLMFRYYTHFTSPIRRYPDQMVHRLLTRYLSGKPSVNQDKCEDLCTHCSDMEQQAAYAERASIKYKQVEFMSDKIGQTFEGKITGVGDFGLFVEIIENSCEGAIPMHTITDDYYEFDADKLCLWGRRHHRRYNFGDVVKIKVVSANLQRRMLDFQLLTADS